jgi:ATP-dependent protease ClpP protease subunit
MFREEIEKGIIAPESVVRAALMQADPGEDLELYINSPGGSVFASHEMLGSFLDWKRATGKQVNVVVGAMAASAASSLSIHLGPVQAHENSMFMFHSAQAVQIGGPEAMADMQDLLDKINKQDIMALVTRYDAPMEAVQEWFSEGRAGWLTAQEAQAIGLVSDIIANEDEVITFPEKTADSLAQRGLAVAALLEADFITETNEDNTMSILSSLAQKLGFEEVPEEEGELEQKIDELEQAAKDADAAYDEGMRAGVEEGRMEAEQAVNERIAELEQKFEGADAKCSELAEELEAAQEALQESERKLSELAPGMTAPDADDAHGVTGDFWQAVDELVESGVSKEKAILTVQREHPDLYQSMIEKANKA